MPRLSVLFPVVVVLAIGCWLARPYLARQFAGGDAPTPRGYLPLANLPIDKAGDKLLADVIARLNQRATITARVRHRAEIDGREFFGQGTYRQDNSSDEPRIKWLLESQRDGLAATLLQVSNGRFLWTDQRLASGRKIHRVDLWQVRRQYDTALAAARQLAPGQASWSAIPTELTSSFGGLAMLIGSLRESFEFTKPQLFNMGDKPVYALIGRWRQEVLADLLLSETKRREQNKLPEDVISANPLPDRLPHHVLVLVGQHDAFPYLIEYRGAGQSAAELASLYQIVEAPLARLEFFDVAFELPIDNREFDYNPPVEPEWGDNTASYMRRLDRTRRYQLAREQSSNMASRPGSAGEGAAPR